VRGGKPGIRVDLTGQRFGRLTVLGIASYNKETYTRKWSCLCDCGKTTEVDGRHLRNGHTQSCGCLGREKVLASITTHGKRHTRLYRTWFSMRQRCRNKNCKDYPRYGGRGITVCESWNNDFTVFETWALANGYTDNLSIDRIDVNGNYEPSNCRWADRKTQSNNTRRNIFITINEETHTVTQWEEIKGIKHGTIFARLYYGWKPEDAVLGKRSKQ